MLSATNPLQITASPVQVTVPAQGADQQTVLCPLDINVLNTGTATLSIAQVSITLPTTFNVLTITPQAGQPNLWYFNASSIAVMEFDAMPASSSSVALEQNASFDFILNTAVLYQQAGTLSIAVLVLFADGSTYSQNVNVPMVTATTSISSFSANPAGINPGQTSILKWQTTGNIDYCLLSPPTGLPHQPASGNYEVNPEYTESYTLTAFGTGLVLSAQVTVQVDRPNGGIAGTNGQTSVDYGEMISLTWSCNEDFTSAIKITCDDPAIVIPTSLAKNGVAPFGPVTNETNFELTLTGLDPDTIVQTSTTITVNAPAFTKLEANPNKDYWVKDAVTLTWQTTSTNTVSFSPEIPGAPNTPSGSVIVYPENDITYTLTATGGADNNHPPMQTTQTITLNPIQVQIFNFDTVPSPILPANGDTNQCELSWVTIAQVVNIDHGIGSVHDSGTTAYINNPVNGTVYTLTAGTNQNPALLTKTATVANGYGPFNITGMTTDGLGNSHITIQNPQWELFPEGCYYYVALTGLTSLNTDPHTTVYASFPDFISLYQLEWDNPSQPTGTMTVISVTYQ